MDNFFATVGKIAGLAGLCVALVAWIFYALIKAKVLSTLDQKQSFRTIRLIVISTLLVAVSGLATSILTFTETPTMSIVSSCGDSPTKLSISFPDPEKEYIVDYGDGTTETAKSEMVHTYKEGKTYTIKVLPKGKSNAVDQEDFIPGVLPRGDFEIAHPVKNRTIVIQNSSEHVGSWSWDFGDGSKSNHWSPKHTYRAPGDYQVSLVVRNGRCFDSVVRIARIE